MKIGLFGNCQASAIGTILSEHLPNDTIVRFKPVHIMNELDKSSLLEQCTGLDVLFHQPVSNVYGKANTENIVQIIGENKSILFPVLYFSSYFLDMTYLKINGVTDRSFISDYHSRIIASAFYYSLPYAKVQAAFESENFFPAALINKSVDDSFAILKNREVNCKIKIQSVLEAKYKDGNCFYTFNHPTGHILFPVIDQFLAMINRPLLSSEIKKKYSRIFGGTHWKSVTSIHEALGIKSSLINNFCINNKIYSLEEFYAISNQFYSCNEHLINLNLDRILPLEYFDRL